MAESGEPHQIDPCQRQRDQKGAAEAVPHPNGYGHDHHHGHTDSRTHQSGQTGHHPEDIVAVRWSIVIHRQEIEEAEEDGPVEADVESVGDVRVAGPVQGEDDGTERGHPGQGHAHGS